MIAFDAFSLPVGGFVDEPGPHSWTHTPVGVPKGAICLVGENNDALSTTVIRYNGVTMPDTPVSPDPLNVAADSTMRANFLGTGLPTGAATVEVSGDGGGNGWFPFFLTVTADGDTELVVDGVAREAAATLMLGGQESFAALVMARTITSVELSPGWQEQARDSTSTFTFIAAIHPPTTSDIEFGGSTTTSYQNTHVIAVAVRDTGGGQTGTQLVPASARHGNRAESSLLQQAHQFSAVSARHSQASAVAALAQAYQLVISNARHNHVVDIIGLVQKHATAVTSALHGHRAGLTLFVQAYALAVADAVHDHRVSTVALQADGVLSPSDALHIVRSTNSPIVQASVLTVLSATHTHIAAVSQFVQDYFLTIAGALHSHRAEATTFEAFYGLLVDNARHRSIVGTAELTQAHVIAILDALHLHFADSVALRNEDWMPAELELLRIELQRAVAKDVPFVIALERTMSVVQRITRRFGF